MSNHGPQARRHPPTPKTTTQPWPRSPYAAPGLARSNPMRLNQVTVPRLDYEASVSFCQVLGLKLIVATALCPLRMPRQRWRRACHFFPRKGRRLGRRGLAGGFLRGRRYRFGSGAPARVGSHRWRSGGPVMALARGRPARSGGHAHQALPGRGQPPLSAMARRLRRRGRRRHAGHRAGRERPGHKCPPARRTVHFFRSGPGFRT